MGQDVEPYAPRTLDDNVVSGLQPLSQAVGGGLRVFVEERLAGEGFGVPSGLVADADQEVHGRLPGELPDPPVVGPGCGAGLEHAAEGGDEPAVLPGGLLR